MRFPCHLGLPLGACALLLGASLNCSAQDLEPRVYSPNPTGTHFVGLAYGRSSGGVLLDPATPAVDVQAELNTAAFSYGRTFSMLGRSAIATLGLPYVLGILSGNVGQQERSIRRSGLADARLRLGLNLKGGSALTPQEFVTRIPETTVGVSLTIAAPSGQYDAQRLVNIGSHRWAFKPELGASWPRGRWYFEAYGGVWFFTPNDDYFRGTRREQSPLATVQTHIVYTARPRLWFALDAVQYRGGRTTIDGERNLDLQSNVRLGLTVSMPAGARQSFKLTWSDGVTTRIGNDFTTLGIAWQYRWVD